MTVNGTVARVGTCKCVPSTRCALCTVYEYVRRLLFGRCVARLSLTCVCSIVSMESARSALTIQSCSSSDLCVSPYALVLLDVRCIAVFLLFVWHPITSYHIMSADILNKKNFNLAFISIGVDFFQVC